MFGVPGTRRCDVVVKQPIRGVIELSRVHSKRLIIEGKAGLLLVVVYNCATGIKVSEKKMTPCDGFWYVFVCGTMMVLIIMYFLMETSPQVRRVNKRGAEENDDKSSWEV
ncbi:uncharacterized protein LOC141875444 [Acropora palmata]|uniref:uncharacterized protein LOC141875444 n=1 Tax=Acropora palmata TaxID=6131 RepID=UPI003DA18D32